MIEILPNWHPIFVHFTVALFVTSGLLFFTSAVFASRSWAKPLQIAAYWNLWLGAFFTIATIGAGFYAYYTVAHDAASHAEMINHRNWAVPTAIAWWVLALWAARMYRRNEKISLGFLAALAIALGMLGLTAFEGGELVYEHGLGVRSDVETPGTAPSHEDNHDHE